MESSAKRLVTGAAAFGIQLGRTQIDRFRRYYLELVDWNSRVNLTSITEWEQVQTRLFLDSLAASTVLPPDLSASGGRILDVGSGAGFPGLPLKIAFPALSVTLIDATAKKTAFLVHVARVLELKDVEVYTGRAEALAHEPLLRESYDVVLARGLARLPVLAELCLPFCRVGGRVVAHKKPAIDQEISDAQVAFEAMGAELIEMRDVTLEGSEYVGALVVLEKTGPTPDRYPRRPGIPAKRPLGVSLTHR
jgi:16S rRNA (guanine527-N7)-methyltransferase